MITLILCLRPLRVPKYVWFKILYNRRYEFGREMTAGEDRETVFIGACTAGNLALARTSFNKDHKMGKAVKAAFLSNNEEIINFLLESRISRKLITYNAARTNNTRITRLLGDANYNALTAGTCRGGWIIDDIAQEDLYYVCKSANLELVKEATNIIGNDYDASNDITDDFRMISLDYAFRKNYRGIALHLLETYRDFYDSYGSGTIYHKYPKQEIYNIVSDFVESSAERVNDCLLGATAHGNIENIEYFIGKGANEFFGCFHVAIENEQIDILKYFAKKNILQYEDVKLWSTNICALNDLELVKAYAHLINKDDAISGIYFKKSISDEIVEYLLSIGAKKPLY